ncbi:MAG: aromatic ring-hydroxylating dioxygenase subunit alpha [Proteobacteria bacterium]|nr:aromatic ring-hydroxylating dioxygenase subunit alpha [Pseudomonadota bacterium]
MKSATVERSDLRSTVPVPARAMPAWIYNHPEMTRLELERILLPSWQVLCHVSQLRHAGDYVTLDIGTESVVGLRDRDGVIRAFHNVCRHRGARLLDGDGNCAGPITCPYHGWSYRHDGALLGVAARDTFPGLDRSEHGLRAVKVDVAFGFVFVALAGDPPPVASTWGTLADDFEPYRFQDMVPLTPITTQTWNVDWKIAMDNYLESYHVPIGHPGLYRMFTPDYDDQSGVPGVARGVSWLREQPSTHWAERRYQQFVGHVSQHLPEANRRCWRFYSMLPNLGIDVFPEQMDFFQVLPAGPGKCTIRGAIYGLPDSSRTMRVVRYLGQRINQSVNGEDEWLCKRVQRGLASGSYTPGPLSELERWMREFHDVLRERIPETRQAQAPAHFA